MSHTFFLVNSKTEINLLDKNLVLLFGSTQNFHNKLNSTYKKINWENNGNCSAIFDNTVLDFYLSDDEVIEKFVMVDVKYSDEPIAEISKLCKKYDWLLFDLEREEYVISR